MWLVSRVLIERKLWKILKIIHFPSSIKWFFFLFCCFESINRYFFPQMQTVTLKKERNVKAPLSLLGKLSRSELLKWIELTFWWNGSESVKWSMLSACSPFFQALIKHHPPALQRMIDNPANDEWYQTFRFGWPFPGHSGHYTTQLLC